MRRRDRLDAILTDLELVPDRLPMPEVAAYLEGVANALYQRALVTEIDASAPPANLDGLASVSPRTHWDRAARALGQTVIAVTWLRADTLGLWVEAARRIYLATDLTAVERAMVLPHELGHARLPRGSHGEVSYLQLAMLAPADVLAYLRPDRPITGHALRSACVWPLHERAAEARARLLRQAEEVGQTG